MISSRRRRRFLLFGGEASPFDPTKLPNLVALYDISDLSTLFVERTGASASTPASVDGVVGTVLDLSGNGNHAVAPSDEARPILRRNGSIYYLEWDEVDDGLIIGALNLASSLRWTVATAYTPSGTDWVLIHSHDNTEPWAGTGQDGSSSTVLVPSSGISQNALYFDNVLSEETTRGGQYTLSQAANRAILDFTVSADFSSVKIGMYTTGEGFFLGPMHAFVIIEGELEAGVRTQLDAWLASRAGVTL